ncbi:MAG: hypothetical protein NT029_15570 [Armatimonadetes bacterium]|nr:hypothetical protein [Armatimonadota bacterium]
MRQLRPATEERVERMLRDAALDPPAGEPAPGFAADALRRRQERRRRPGFAVRLAAAGAALAGLWFAVRQPDQPTVPPTRPPAAAIRPAPGTPYRQAVGRRAPVRVAGTDKGPRMRLVRADQRPRKTAAATVRPGGSAAPSWKSEELPVYEAGMITPAVVAERDEETGRVVFHPALMNIPIGTDRQGRMMGVSGTPSVMPVSYSEETR